jgi:hypothetical protein
MPNSPGCSEHRGGGQRAPPAPEYFVLDDSLRNAERRKAPPHCAPELLHRNS